MGASGGRVISQRTQLIDSADVQIQTDCTATVLFFCRTVKRYVPEIFPSVCARKMRELPEAQH